MLFQVADEMLRIAKRRGMALTPLQLMKLVYIAHGWYLAIKGSDLFNNRIEAWKYGPVIPDLYQATKQYGREPIPLSLIGNGESGVSAETRRFLEDVFEKYGHRSGFQLSQLTHKPGTPWATVYQEGVMGIEIPDDLIRAHYQELLNDRRSSSAA
jgi:uncharacterized phage-associated protein